MSSLNQLPQLATVLFWFAAVGLAVGIIIAVCYIKFLMPKQSTSQAVGVGILAVLIFAVCGGGFGAVLGLKEVFSKAVDAVVSEVKPRVDSALTLAGLNPENLPTGQAAQIVQKLHTEIEGATGKSSFSWGPAVLLQIDESDLPSLKKPSTGTAEILGDLKTLAEKRVMGLVPWVLVILLLFPLGFALVVHIMVKSEKKEAQKVQDAADNGHIRL